MTNRVLVATHLGLCFGVRDALARARSLPDPSRVTIHGELVHNEAIQEDLRRRGFRVTLEDRRDALPSTRDVLVTAHGISMCERCRLERAGHRLIDTTCPLVRRVHEAAASLAREGRRIVVIGRRGHVEVRGVVEDLEDPIVVEHTDEVRPWGDRALGIVAQTTAPPREAARVRERVSEMNPGADIRYVNTICAPTRQRQEAVESLLARVQGLVVVGGRRSHNTARLAEVARQGGVPARVVTGADELDPEWCAAFDSIGLTAGTSTPDETVRAVHQRLLALAACLRTRVPA